jgi:BASS family bile acid:Na+ symporter
MSLAALILLVVKASIFLTVFALGLEATVEDALYVLRRPAVLVRSLLAMNVIMPIVAVALALAFDFSTAVEIALLALALSPVPPLLPKKEFRAGGRSSYTIGLLVAVTLLAIAIVPITVHLIGRLIGRAAYLGPAAVAQLVFMSALLPLAAGMAVRRFAPKLADHIARPLALVAAIMLAAGVLPILFSAWPEITSLIGNGTIVAIVTFTIIALAAGHLLGGPDPDGRTVLALSTASRHPGIALAIAHASFPGNKHVLGAVLLYLIVSAIASIPYMNWRKRHRAD